jgi:hypothetical protein
MAQSQRPYVPIGNYSTKQDAKDAQKSLPWLTKIVPAKQGFALVRIQVTK